MKEKEPIPEWLIEQERNSWQIELLISGGFIFALAKFPEYIISVLYDIGTHNDVKTHVWMVFLFSILASRALLIGFVVNLVLRALWVAFLGIHYAFPNGVDYSKLKYSKDFEKRFGKDNQAINRILKLETYCSLSYSLAIIISILSIGICLLVAILFFIIEQVDFLNKLLNNQFVGYPILIFLLLLGLGILDNLFFKKLNVREKTSGRLYRISKFISKISLTSIYRYEWFTLISNVNRYKVHLTTSFYFVLAFIITINDLGMKDSISKNFNIDFFETRKFKSLPASRFYLQNDEYDDLLQPEDFVESVSIPSELIDEEYLSIFITYRSFFDEYFSVLFEENNFESKQGVFKKTEEFHENSIKLQDALKKNFMVVIDSQQVVVEHWYYRNHPITEQEGFYTKVDISKMEIGKHDLQMKYVGFGQKEQKDTFTLRWIPFWKIDD